MSSYQSLLSLSPADWIGESEFADDDRSAVSSYLSFDATGEECCHHNPPEAAFHADQRAPEAPPLFDTLEADYCESGMAGSSSEGEPGRHSQADNGSFAGGATSACLPVPARNKKGGGKIAFKTRSEVDVLDDGYRWRKYGKKLLKDSPNPRNYYRCAVEGCPVKKRVERARDDARFVITTYHGVHSHPAAPPPPHPLHIGYR